MTFSLHGIGVSRGYAIGRTYLLQRNQPEIAEYTIPDAIIEDEVQRFLNSLDIARRQLQDIREQVPPDGAGRSCRLYRHPFADAGRRDFYRSADQADSHAQVQRRMGAENPARCCWCRCSTTWTIPICAPARTMSIMW